MEGCTAPTGIWVYHDIHGNDLLGGRLYWSRNTVCMYGLVYHVTVGTVGGSKAVNA
jgi:hypothetical protein